MLKGAFIGDPGARCLTPAAFNGKDLAISAFFRPGAPGKRQAFPDRAKEYLNLKSLFETEMQLDFAAISLPPVESAGAIKLALERGLHVVCEPPFCLSSAEFEKLRAAAERAERTIFPLQPWEHSASWLALDKAITRGLAGKINFAEVQALVPGPPPEEGAAGALGWQAFSMLLGMVRRPPTAIEARLEKGTAAFHAHFGTADGFVHIARGAHAPRLRAAAAGDNGRLEIDGKLLRLDIRDLPTETVELRFELAPGACHPEWLAAELSDFRKEITGELPRGAGLRNARYCVKLLRNASYSAAVRSAAVPL